MAPEPPMLRARVSDPVGPHRWRTALRLAGLPLAALSIPAGMTAFVTTALLATAWAFASDLLVGHLPPRDAEVHVDRGRLQIARAGVVSQRVEARALCGAAVARPQGRPSVVLARDSVREPLWLELASDEDERRLRGALGIGRGGFGTVSWPARGRGLTAPALRVLASLGWLAMAVTTAVSAVEITLGLALGVLPLSFFAAVLALSEGRDGRACLTLGRESTFSRDEVEVSCREILGARVEGDAVHLATKDWTIEVPMPAATADEREQAAATIQAAAERTREAASTTDATSLAPLLPAEHEDSRGWLERIDALAASLAGADGYRRIGLAMEDLWAALDSPDAPAIVRAAAARLLARIAPEEARRRIGDALSVERDEVTRARIRVALEEDVDVAARGLDRLAGDRGA